jgi:hypothetical protein
MLTVIAIQHNTECSFQTADLTINSPNCKFTPNADQSDSYFKIVSTPVISPISASCSASPSTAVVGEKINWGVKVSGGSNGYNFAWSGSDGLSAGNVPGVAKTYTTSGVKQVSVTVKDGQLTTTASCQVSISLPTVSAPTANLTVNGVKDLTINPGQAYTYKWSSTNGVSATSNWTSNDSAKCWAGGVGPANTLSGSVTENNVKPENNGCIWTINYTVKNSEGKTVTDSVIIRAKTITTVTPSVVKPEIPATTEMKDCWQRNNSWQVKRDWNTPNKDGYWEYDSAVNAQVFYQKEANSDLGTGWRYYKAVSCPTVSASTDQSKYGTVNLAWDSFLKLLEVLR